MTEIQVDDVKCKKHMYVVKSEHTITVIHCTKTSSDIKCSIPSSKECAVIVMFVY